jgi:hypothetical protein
MKEADERGAFTQSRTQSLCTQVTLTMWKTHVVHAHRHVHT